MGYIDGLKNALAPDDRLCTVYEATLDSEARTTTQIAEKTGIDGREVLGHLGKLQGLHAVEGLKHPQSKSKLRYRRIP